jgi:hypothetical protein
MPSTNLRDGLPSYYRSQMLRRVAAAVIRSTERGRSYATARRPSIRVTAFVGTPEQATPTESPTTPSRQEPRALSASPERPHVEAETERMRERVRRHPERRDQ